MKSLYYSFVTLILILCYTTKVSETKYYLLIYNFLLIFELKNHVFKVVHCYDEYRKHKRKMCLKVSVQEQKSSSQEDTNIAIDYDIWSHRVGSQQCAALKVCRATLFQVIERRTFDTNRVPYYRHLRYLNQVLCKIYWNVIDPTLFEIVPLENVCNSGKYQYLLSNITGNK